MIGSQAILASISEERLPPGATMSVEADIVPLDDRDGTKSVLVDGSVGEESLFHETFGVYAHGVGERTARLPQGWRDRLVPLSNDNTNGLTGWCLEPHDLVVAKLLAGRPQHRRFCRALLQAGVVGETIILDRLAATAATDQERERVARAVRALGPARS